MEKLVKQKILVKWKNWLNEKIKLNIKSVKWKFG